MLLLISQLIIFLGALKKKKEQAKYASVSGTTRTMQQFFLLKIKKETKILKQILKR